MMTTNSCATENTTFVRGVSGEPECGQSENWYSHLGKVKTYQVRKTGPALKMTWQTAPVPANVATKTVTFAWSGVMYGAPFGKPYRLYVNGKAAADFDVRIKPTRYAPLAKGVQFLYDAIYMYNKYGSSAGHLYLTVPAKWVEAGKPATLEVRAEQSRPGGWFGIVESDDAPLELPSGTFRPFVALPRPPLAPPEGKEGSYEWYKPQYRDIGIFTPIGPPGDPAEVAVSPEGQLIHANDNLNWRGRIGGTNPPYIKNGLVFALYDGERIVPVGTGELARQSLAGGYVPVVTTQWKYGAIEVKETAFAEPMNAAPYETGHERTLAWAGFELMNTSKSRRTVTLLAFYVGQAHNVAPKMTYRDGAVIKAGSAVFAAQLPKNFTAEFAPTFPTDVQAEGKDEMIKALAEHKAAFNAIVVTGSIAGGGTTRIVFNRVFDFPGTMHWKAEKLPAVKPQELTQRSFDRGLEGAYNTWQSHARQISRFQTPEPMLNNIVRKSMLDGYFLTKRWNGRYIVFDSVCYRCQWDDASTKWFYALDLMGDHATAEKLLDTVFERQGNRKPGGTRTREGCFSDVTNIGRDGSNASWSSCNGWALWAMAEHARLTNNTAWLEKHKEKILEGAEWIIRERNFSKEKKDDPCAGLLFGKFVCDLPGGQGYFPYTDAISYLGLHQIAKLLDEGGYPEGKRLLTEAEAYRQDIIAATDRLTDKSSDPWFVPWIYSKPKDRNRYFHDIVGPINLAFGGVLPRDDERIDHVIRWIIDRVHQGSVEEAAAGPHNPESGGMFYSQDLAIVLLELDRVEEFLRIFYTLLGSNLSHETLTTGEWGGNTQPHIHSVSSLIRMFRTMLIQERDGSLYVLQGTPRRWLANGEQLKIVEAPTWYGPLSLACVSDVARGRVTINMTIPERIGTTPVRVRLRLPDEGRIKSVKVNGRKHAGFDGEWIVLKGLKGKVRIEATVK